MNWFIRYMIVAITCLLASGCSRPSGQPRLPSQKYKFLGVAEDETSTEGPVGLIGGRSIRVSNVSKVQEVPYLDYRRAKEGSRIVAEEKHDGFVYWAVEEQRDVPFENATAWVTILERFKSRIKIVNSSN